MTAPDGLDGLDRLGAALAEIGDALAAADLDRLLAAEAAIGVALDRAPMRLASGEPAAALIERARAELLRSQRLGRSLTEFVRASMQAQGLQSGYSRSGTVAPEVRSGSVVARG